MQTPKNLNDEIPEPPRATGQAITGDALLRSNVLCARRVWGRLSKQSLTSLTALTKTYGLSVIAGHLHFLDGRWYVTHAGLLNVAHNNRCAGMRTAVEKQLSDPGIDRWVFKATVYKSTWFEGFRRLRRRGSLKCFSPRSRRRDARGRNARRQPRSAQSLRHRA